MRAVPIRSGMRNPQDRPCPEQRSGHIRPALAAALLRLAAVAGLALAGWLLATALSESAAAAQAAGAGDIRPAGDTIGPVSRDVAAATGGRAGPAGPAGPAGAGQAADRPAHDETTRSAVERDHGTEGGTAGLQQGPLPSTGPENSGTASPQGGHSGAPVGALSEEDDLAGAARDVRALDRTLLRDGSRAASPVIVPD